MRLLLDAGAYVDHKRENGVTALQCACLGTSSHGYVRMLLDANATVDLADNQRMTALDRGNVRLLIDAGASCASHDGVLRRSRRVCADAGRRQDPRRPDTCNTELRLAVGVGAGHSNCVELLLNHRANLEHTDRNGSTTCACNHESCVSSILAAKADLIPQAVGRIPGPLSSSPAETATSISSDNLWPPVRKPYSTTLYIQMGQY